MEAIHRQRLFLSIFFFISGVCFSTWASRIPTIKETFNFNDAELGTILFFMPITSLIGLPISGWLVSRFDSRIPLLAAFILMTISLACIGFAETTVSLVAFICLFAFSLRMVNISVNTQAVTIQKQFDRKITGAFHGLWSAGGVIGVGISTVFVALEITMKYHLLIISAISILATFYCYQYLIRNDRTPSANKFKIGKPDPTIVYLGLLLFFAAICEGGMFDWSGIYFREVVNVDIFTWGYLIFIICMSLSRFVSDTMMERMGMPKTFIVSSCFIITGISLAIIFPSFWFSMIGFCLVGFGTAPVVPMTYILAGSSKKYSPGIVISIIATYGIAGMLIGPPLIGYLSHAFNLRISFIAFALSGLMLVPISQRFFAYQRSLE